MLEIAVPVHGHDLRRAAQPKGDRQVELMAGTDFQYPLPCYVMSFPPE
jgi:hypothetical protein